MHRSTPPPSRLLVVAAAVVATADVADGAYIVRDGLVAAVTGYALRTVKLAYQELAELDMAVITQSVDGVRQIRPTQHPVWTAAMALAGVTA
jgi:hypothetical protein